MFNIIEKKITWGGKDITLQTGKIARQADGAVVASYGNSSVLATVVFAKKAQPNIDFFPLGVHYQDKYYAVGKIPGGFFKREGKPSEKEVLFSRLIDRPIRPLFDDKFRNEVQVVVSVLNYDNEHNLDVLSIVAASAALAISGIPMMDIVGSAKVGYVDGKYILNPSLEQAKKSSLDLMVAGTKEGVLMVESEAFELSEKDMLDAVKFAHQGFAPIINLIEELKQAVNKPIFAFEVANEQEGKDLYAKLTKIAKEDLIKAFQIVSKSERNTLISEIESKAKNDLLADFSEEFLSTNFKESFKNLEKEIVRGNILNNKIRIDGRNLTQIRPIEVEVGLFPNVHGSALFTRGETQALVFTTLGTDNDEQIMDGIDGEYKERFMLNYNFPPFSVGEIGRLGSPGRREIGHGKLAWRSINPMLPSKESFPYALRVVSEITESNGSSSMATVCGTSLSLMNAGVPLKKPVAGIAMGLIKEDKNFAVLSDILGDEDHLGDMDFKVAGTVDGITSLQMDIKITSINYEIMEIALAQALEGRKHILGIMNKVISKHSDEINSNAPQVKVITIDKDKIKEVIGSGGKIIKEICEVNDVKIDISNEGVVKIYGKNSQGLANALATVQGIVAVPEVNAVYNGKVVKVLEFGAFVNLFGNCDGLLHISEITKDRNANINDLIKAGDSVEVRIVQIEDKGKIRLALNIK